MQWGGSGIEECVFDAICKLVPDGECVLELGAGHVSTCALSERYNVYSIEESAEWVRTVASNYRVAICHAPLVNDWYDVQAVREFLQDKQYRLVLVDGPSCSPRTGILENFWLFDKWAYFVFHDSNRSSVANAAVRCAEYVSGTVQFFTDGDTYAIVTPGGMA